ncbi:MAG: peroxide stress protein YaaA, partial [Marinoscillum sp.]
DLMNVSDKIAELNYNRFKSWEEPSKSDFSKQAIYAFKGDVYSGLDAESILEDKFDFLQENLRIISGYYGLIRPFDKILPYRLEMGTKLRNSRGKNLYEFWGDNITNLLNNDIEDKNSYVVNLASNEYFKSIKKNKLKNEIITPIFKEFKNGTYKTIAIYAKKARGLMSRFIIDNKIQKPENLKAFNLERYSFDTKLSDNFNYVFTR